MAGTYQYRLSVTQDAGCDVSGAPIQVTVLVDPQVTVAIDDSDICEGGTSTLTATVTGGTGTTMYKWQLEDNLNVWNDISGATNSSYTTLPLTAGTFNYRVLITQDNGCDQISLATVITAVVDPIATISADDDQICEGGVISLTSTVTGGAGATFYQWQVDSTGAFEDISGANSANYTTPAMSAGSFDYRLLTTQDAGCDATSNVIAVDVVDDPTVSLVADFTSICQGGAASITATVAGGAGPSTYKWQFFDGGAWVDIAGAASATYVTSTLSVGSYQYRTVITQDAGCDVTSDPIIISVVADPTVSVTADDLEICNGGSVTLTAVVSGGAGTPVYRWQSFNGSAWVDISGATSDTYTAVLSTPDIYRFRVLVTQDAGCSVVGAPIAITVVADPVVTIVANEDQICEGGTAVLTAGVTGGAGSASYQWESFDGSTWSIIDLATNAIYSTAFLNAGTFQFRVIVTQDAGCQVTSDPYSIIVVTDPTVLITATDSEICSGGTIMLTSSVSGGAGSATYQWEFENGGWGDISGATSDSYSTIINTPGTYNYRLRVSQANGCETTSTPVVVTVVADPVVTVSADETEICDGGSVILTASITGGSGANTIQWEFNLPGTGWTDIGGATSLMFNTSTLTIGSYSYRVRVTQDVGCATTSAPITINVTAGPTVSVAMSDTEICDGGSATFTATVTGGNGTTTYQWQNDPGTGWLDISGATTDTYTTGSLTPDVYSYQVIIMQNLGCTVTSATAVVTVLDDPVIVVSVDDNGICSGGTVTLSSTTTGGTGSDVYQWQLDDGTNGWQDIGGATTDSYTTDILLTGFYDYRLQVTQGEGCFGESNVITVTVVDGPTVSVTADNSTICADGMVTLTAAVSGGAGATSFQWEFNDLTNGWINIGGATSITYTTSNLTTGTYSYRVRISQDAGCDTVSLPAPITVIDDPEVSVVSSNTSICDGGTVTLTATVTGGTGAETIQWQEEISTNNWQDIGGANALIFTTPTLSTGIYSYRVEVTQGNGCFVSGSANTIVVVDDPVVTISSDFTDICDGGVATLTANITGGTGTTTYQWQSNPGTGWADILDETNSTYTTQTLGVGVHPYRVLITQNPGCDVVSNQFDVNVVADPTVTVTSDDNSICAGGSVTLTSALNGGTGTETYLWQEEISSGNWQDISGADQPAYTTGILTSGSYNYRVQITQDAGCFVESAVTTITVVDGPIVTAIVDNATICDGGIATLTAGVSGGSGTTLYQWQFNNGTSWEDITGETGMTFTTSTLVEGLYNYRVRVSQDAGCDANSAAVLVTVIADPTVSVAIGDNEICSGGTTTLTATVSGGTGTTTYQWQTDPGGGYIDISGATTDTYTTPSLSLGSHDYQVVITQGNGCAVNSITATVVVIADPVSAIAVDDNEICNGGIVNFTSSVTGGSGANTYQWQLNDNGGGWADISGATFDTYASTSLTTGSYDYRLIVDQDAGCTDTSNVESINVVADPTVSVVVDDASICDGGAATLTATVTGGTGTSMFQWQFKDTGVWGDIAGANQDIYSTGSLTIGSFEYRVIVTQDEGCEVTSDSVVVVGVSDATVSVVADDLIICDGATATMTATVTGGTGTPTYQWEINLSGTWTVVTGATSLAFTTAMLTTGTYQYRLVVTQDSGCSVTSSAITITVVADPTVSVVAVDTAICAGVAAELEAFVTGGVGVTSYQWQINNTGWQDIGSATDSTLTTSALTTGTYEYKVLITQDLGCAVESAVVTITVANDPTVGVSVDDGDICEGGTVTLSSSVAGGSGTSSYQWQILNASVWDDIVGADSASYTSGALSTGSYAYQLVVTQNAGCETTSATVNVNVVNDPLVTVTYDDNQICEGGSAVLTALVTGGTGTTTYQWQQNTGSSGWQDLGTETASTLSLSALAIGSYTYRVIVMQDAGCEVISTATTITVVAQPTVSVSANDNEICDGGTVTIDANVTGGAGTTSYQWQEFSGAAWGDLSGEMGTSMTTAALTVGNYAYRLLVTQDNGCDVTSDSIVVTVVADPTISIAISDTDICEDGIVSLSSTLGGGTGSPVYLWEVNDGNGWVTIGGATADNYTSVPLPQGSYQYRLSVTQDAGCFAQSNAVSVTVVADPTVSVALIETDICNGGFAVLTATVTNGTGGTSYSWERYVSGTGWVFIPGASAGVYTTATLATGDYAYRVVVTQGAGCSVIGDSIPITVLDDPTITVLADDTELCEGGAVTISSTVTGGAGASTYQWEIEGPVNVWTEMTNETNANLTTQPLTAGNYSYRLVVSQGNGCSVTSASVNVTVVADPTVGISSNTLDVCDGGFAMLTANVGGGSGTTLYQWQFFNSTWTDVSGAMSATFSTPILTTGVYSYRVVIAQDAGCDVISDSIAINVLDDPTITIASDNDSICVDGIVTLTSVVTGGAGTATYQWEVNTGSSWDTIVGATNNSYTTDPLAIGTYLYRLNVAQGDGCSAQSLLTTVTVIPDPTVTIAAEDTEICDEGFAVITANVIGGTGSTVYQWEINNSGWQVIPGADSSTLVTQALAIGSYTYRVVITQSAGCEASSVPVIIDVVPDPVIAVSIDDASICEGGIAALTASVTGGTGTTSYQWQIKNPGWQNVTAGQKRDICYSSINGGNLRIQSACFSGQRL